MTILVVEVGDCS